MKKIILFIFCFFTFSIFSMKEIEGDSVKPQNRFNLTFSALFIPQKTTTNKWLYILEFGTAFEKRTKIPKLSSVICYANKFRTDRLTYSSLTYGYNYNLLKNHKLNFGLHTGFSLYNDPYYYKEQYTFCVPIKSSVDYFYCFKKSEIGIHFSTTFNFGNFIIYNDETYKLRLSSFIFLQYSRKIF